MARKFEVSSYWKIEDIARAAILIKSGQPVGVFNRGMCSIWGDPGSETFLKTLSQIKGQPGPEIQLMGAALSEHLVTLMDVDRIAERLRVVFTNPREIVHRFGALAALQLPVKASAVSELPHNLVSEIAEEGQFMSNWEPSGHHPAHQLVSGLAALGIPLPVFTPMDSFEKAEIYDQYEGILFSEEHGIPLFLEDYHDNSRVRGAHTSLKVDGNGVKVLQEGTVPGVLFDVLVGEPVDTSSSMAARLPQKPFPVQIPDNTSPQAARLAILCYLQGWSTIKLSQFLVGNGVLPTSRKP